ncbi:hypothetical protein ACFL0O_01030 [Thermodesulfobacteriota bacterium]
MSLFIFNSNPYFRIVPINSGRLFLFTFVSTLFIFFCGNTILIRYLPYQPPFASSDSYWIQNLRKIRNSPKSLKIVFYGSSRTQLNISPYEIVKQLSLRGKTVGCWNLALAKSEDTGLLAHVGEGLKANVVVLEQLGLQFSTPIKADDLKRFEKAKLLNWRYHLENNIKRNMEKRFPVLRGSFIQFLFNRTYLYFYYHDNGWREVKFNKYYILQKKNRKKRVEYTIKNVSKDEAIENQKRYEEYFNYILKQGTVLVIIRMPVGGEIAKMEKKLLSDSYHIDFILRNPNILYIDANKHLKLKNYNPIDDSHLDASDAINFSKDLAIILDEWLEISER